MHTKILSFAFASMCAFAPAYASGTAENPPLRPAAPNENPYLRTQTDIAPIGALPAYPRDARTETPPNDQQRIIHEVSRPLATLPALAQTAPSSSIAALKQEARTIEEKQKNMAEHPTQQEAAALHETITKTRHQAAAIKKNLAAPPASTNIAPAALKSETASSENEALIKAIEALDQELENRQKLIEQLLAISEPPSPLAANLTALSTHPVATSFISAAIITLLYLLKGRIAELSGFGIKITFKDRHEKHHHHKKR